MKIHSEVLLRYEDLYAGTSDIVCLNEEIDAGVEFDEATHSYTYNGIKLPSVTQLIDDGSYANVPSNILKRASDYGTKVHKEVEEYLKYGKKTDSDGFNQFLVLYIKNKFLFEKEGIFDIKTFSSIDKHKKEKAKKQMILYSKAIKYLTGKEINDLYIIWLPKNKEGEIIKL